MPRKPWVSDFVNDALGRAPPKAPKALAPDDYPRCSGVYFLQAGSTQSPVKIGFGANIRQRIQHLQVAHPSKLRLLGYERIDEVDLALREYELHQKFARFHIRGEWFDVGVMKYVRYIGE